MESVDIFLVGEPEKPITLDGNFGFDPQTLSYIVQSHDGKVWLFPIRAVQMIVRTPSKIVSLNN